MRASIRIRSSSSSESVGSTPASSNSEPGSPNSWFGTPPSSPKATTDVCSSGSISTLAANLARSRFARTASPRPGSVSSRKSSAAWRTTTSGAISRDFGVRRSAWHGAAVTSFDSIRWRNSSVSGPDTRT
jgi:hypothetical protein